MLNFECNVKLHRITSKTPKLTFNCLKQESTQYKIREKGIFKRCIINYVSRILNEIQIKLPSSEISR